MIIKYFTDEKGTNWISPKLMFTEDQWEIIEACLETIKEHSGQDLTESKCFEFMAAEFLNSCNFDVKIKDEDNSKNKSFEVFNKNQENRDNLSKNMYVMQISKSRFCVANVYKHTSYVVVVSGKENEKCHCECPDFYHRDFLCKHVEAVKNYLKNN